MTATLTADDVRCHVHGIPDCSPMLNGCSVPNVIADRIRARMVEPHAYVIEVLVNAGSMSEHWKILDDSYDIVERSDTADEAAQQRDLLIEDGYRPQHLRVVGLVTL